MSRKNRCQWCWKTLPRFTKPNVAGMYFCDECYPEAREICGKGDKEK